MKPCFLSVSVGTILVSLLISCGHKTDATSELEKAAKSIQQAEAQMPATPVTSAAAIPAPAAMPAPTAPTQSVAPAQQLNQAIAAYKGNNLEDAVQRLQALRAKSAMSPQQMMALQEAIAAVMNDIGARAAKGDQRAQQALKVYEAIQTGARR